MQKPRGHLTLLVLAGLLAACASRRYDDIEKSQFLRPYVAELKSEASATDLSTIAAMSKSELILLLHGYGTGLRNRWIHGNRDPELVRFFHDHGVDDPEAMSMLIIYILEFPNCRIAQRDTLHRPGTE